MKMIRILIAHGQIEIVFYINESYAHSLSFTASENSVFYMTVVSYDIN